MNMSAKCLATSAIAAVVAADGHIGGYGPVYPTKDLTTGLELLALPKNFTYMSYGWTGQYMSDGQITPTDHDGMAVVDRIGNIISMVRNHETTIGDGAQILAAGTYNSLQFGGTTNLYFDLVDRKFVGSDSTLGGCVRNCAGGPTPWGSWISAEETLHYDEEAGIEHGYLFDVLGFGGSDGVAIKDAGRFSHEAIAVDPSTGIVYETEDARPAGFYKYVQPGAGARNWTDGFHKGSTLHDGGELYVLKVVDQPGLNLYGWPDECDGCAPIENGATFNVEWVKIADPAPTGPMNETDAGPDAEYPAIIWQADGAAHFTRLEGIWWHEDLLYFIATDGGLAKLGQVWTYNPSEEIVTMVYESPSADAVDGPDNVAISPAGSILLCEDGDSDPKRLIGLTKDGEPFTFAENHIVLTMAEMDVLEMHFPGTKENFHDVNLGSFTSMEWAGATFYGDWLFVNIQTPGVTFAITGPWEEGIF